MSRALLFGLAAALLASACAIPPSDVVQIRRLIEEEAEARARGDTGRLYRLHDPDFRAICARDQFLALPNEQAETAGVRDIEIRGVRGWATVDLTTGGSERRSFVKDAGRWYVYADTRACRLRSTFQVPGSTVHLTHRGTWNLEPGTPNRPVAPHG
jgi:hypothetical protein